MNILEKIVHYKIHEIKILKEKYSFIHESNLSNINEYSLIDKIKVSKTISIIAEIKRGSPSKGLFAPNLDITSKAMEYQTNGATCISVLTDKKFFYGSYNIMKSVRNSVHLPILCKEFIIDEFQIKLAKYFGANVILLIKRILSTERFTELLNYAKKLKLEVLVEVDSKEEFDLIKHLEFELCGVNNRDLSNFTINLNKTMELSSLIKNEGKLLISESGISSKEQILELRSYNIDGILIGESLVKSKCSTLLLDLKTLKEKLEVKICGITDKKTALHVEASGADYIGFVFAKSKRRISVSSAKEIIKGLSSIKTVGVFLDESPNVINKIYRECNLDYVQIHGDSNFDLLTVPKDKIIPAYSFKVSQIENYEYILIDGVVPGQGKPYDLKNIKINPSQKYFLAGGLNCENVVDRALTCQPNIVDISSGVETNQKKDQNKITNFINIVGGI